MASELEAFTAAVPKPTNPTCAQCGGQRVALAFSEFTKRWWILCKTPGCLHLAPATT